MDKTIRFIKNHSPYCARDIASFDEESAARYIGMGVAENWTEKANIVNKAGAQNATNNRPKGKKLSGNKSK